MGHEVRAAMISAARSAMAMAMTGMLVLPHAVRLVQRLLEIA